MGRAAEIARQIGWYWGTLMGDNHYWRMRHDATEANPNPRCC
jgi:hypothetical protein